MHHFFVTKEQVRATEILILGQDVSHIKQVLRMKPGEQVKVNDGDSHTYLGEIKAISEQEVTIEIIEMQKIDSELPNKIYLFQGLPKGDKMEFIIQKAVELGVSEVIPVSTKRSIVKLDEKKAKKKVQRWNTIAESGAKQSGRGVIPVVTDVMNYKQALEYAQKLDVVLLPYELAEEISKTKEIVGQIQTNQSIGVFIGPEGGFEKEEVEQAVGIGSKVITLGKRILRTETASVAILAILMYQLES